MPATYEIQLLRVPGEGWYVKVFEDHVVIYQQGPTKTKPSRARIQSILADLCIDEAKVTVYE